jgi:lysophospholipase L1-like esterase
MRARDALGVIVIVCALLAVFEGRSVRKQGEEMKPGWERTLVLAIGKPAGFIADRLPLEDWLASAMSPLKSGDDLGSGPGGFSANGTGNVRGVPPVTPDAFDPTQLGVKPVPPRPLKTVLITGDSMAIEVGNELARRLAGTSVKAINDPHVGTGLSFDTIVDWGKLSTHQVKTDKPDAVVVFIGANEGFDLKYNGKSYKCCGPQWSAAYATRARTVMNTFRQNGVARVYWLLLPGARDSVREKIVKAVNLSDTVAAQPYRAQVRILDMSAIFTPGGKYRDAMNVGGQDTIVRQADGIHLNGAGAQVAVKQDILPAMRADYGNVVPQP